MKQALYQAECNSLQSQPNNGRPGKSTRLLHGTVHSVRYLGQAPSNWHHVPPVSTGLAMQGCWEALEQVVRMAWAAHCEAQLQAAVDQLRVADSRADDSLSEVRKETIK